MGAPYSSQSVSNYNSNPPPDDGSQTEANRIKWATIKTKLSDPLNTFASAVNTAIGTAFGKIIGGAGVTSTSTSYQVLSTDQGKLVRASASGITITTPDATDVGSPFVFGILNDSDGDITVDGSGSQTIDGSETVTLPANTGLLLFTDGSNWMTTGQNFQRTQIIPQGYLTLVPEATDALAPFPASDQSAKTAVYYRPDTGNLIPIPDGTNFSVKTFTELTLTLVANHVADAIYDVFVFDDDGTLRIGTGPAWNNAAAGSGARGSGAGTTELTRLKGLLVNTNAITARNGSSTYSVDAKCGLYVGSILMDGSNGQVTCHVSYGQNRKWGVWNAYNRRRIAMQSGDSTSNWTYSSATFRASNNSSSNKITVFRGLVDGPIQASFRQNINESSAATYRAQIAIGINSTSSASGFIPISRVFINTVGAMQPSLAAHHVFTPSIGRTELQMLEAASDAAAVQFNGTNQNMLLSTEYFG